MQNREFRRDRGVNLNPHVRWEDVDPHRFWGLFFRWL
jgi:hypothetical protein